MDALGFELALLRGAHDGGTPRCLRSVLGGHYPSQRIRQGAKRQLGIGDEADVDGEVFGDLVGVEIDMHNRGAWGEDCRK